MTDTVLISDPQPGVRLLTINRPERRNALNRATYAALGAAIAAADAEEAVRAIVLTGAEGCFTAGNDLGDFQDTSDAGPSAGLTFLRGLTACSKPLIAAVEGFAVGIGTTLLLHCDLAYAGAGATFRLPFAHLGLCPEGASSFLLPRIAGTKKAAELLMLGNAFGPDIACDAGLVNAVTAKDGALAAALEKAGLLAALPAESVVATKRLLRAHTQEAVAAALELEAESFHALRRGPAAQAAFARFFKR